MNKRKALPFTVVIIASVQSVKILWNIPINALYVENLLNLFKYMNEF